MELPVSPGRVATVDAADLPLIGHMKWTMIGKYVGTKQKGQTVYLHRHLLGLSKGDRRQGDHCNRNPLDNRRCNIRIVPAAVNYRNRGRYKTNTSGFTGVTWDKRKKRWIAFFTVNSKNRTLGAFKKLEDAIAARTRADGTFDHMLDKCQCDAN